MSVFLFVGVWPYANHLQGARPSCLPAVAARLSFFGYMGFCFWFPMPLAVCECFPQPVFAFCRSAMHLYSIIMGCISHPVEPVSVSFSFSFSFPCRHSPVTHSPLISDITDRQPLTRLSDWLHGKHNSLSIAEIHDCSSSHLVTLHAAALSISTLTCLGFLTPYVVKHCRLFFAYHRLSSIVDSRRLVFCLFLLGYPLALSRAPASIYQTISGGKHRSHSPQSSFRVECAARHQQALHKRQRTRR